MIWPSAITYARLLSGATSKLEADPSLPGSPTLRKRYSSEAFGITADNATDVVTSEWDTYIISPSPTNMQQKNGQAKLAQMLDLKIPNVTLPLGGVQSAHPTGYGAAPVLTGNED